MNEITQRESLNSALSYLEKTNDAIIEGIEIKTKEILSHKSKWNFGVLYRESGDEIILGREDYHEWRRISNDLHLRRSELKVVRDRLVLQIMSVRQAISELNTECINVNKLTHDRRDGLSKVIFWHIGDVSGQVEKELLTDEDDLELSPPAKRWRMGRCSTDNNL